MERITSSSSNHTEEKEKSVFICSEYLSGASDGLLYLCERLFLSRQIAALKGIKHRTVDLFIRLSFFAYGRASQNGGGDGLLDIEVSEGLALLLHPMSVIFELEAILGHSLRSALGRTSEQQSERQMFRNLWYVLVLFRVKETSRWGHYGNWFELLIDHFRYVITMAR